MRYRHAYLLFVLILLLPLLLLSRSYAESAPDTIKDLRYGEALYYFYQEKYFSSITRLMQAKKFNPVTKQRDTPELLLGGLFINYGLRDEANKIFHALLEAKTDIDPQTKDQAWYYLGKSWYMDNQADKSLYTLNQIGSSLPPEQNNERLHLLSNVLMYKGKYNDVNRVLDDIDSGSIWKNYTQYNLGVSLIKTGEINKGLAFLEDACDINPGDNESAGLRDRCYLARGFAYIQQNEHAEAIKQFKKIRLKGPISNKALLGMGWAYIQNNAYQLALTPLKELTTRNAIDPSVQEALLATPWVMEKAGAIEEALTEYEITINILAKEKKKLKDSIESIKNNKISSILNPQTQDLEIIAPLELKNSKSSISLIYLNDLLATREFQNAYRNYRDLYYLRSVLTQWEQKLPVLRTMLSERKSAYQGKLNRISTDSRIHSLNQYSLRTTRLTNEINTIDNNDTRLLLANNNELEQLALLDKIQEKIINFEKYQNLDDVKYKSNLIRGLLTWEINTDYAPRYWKAKKQLQQLKSALIKASNSKEKLTQSWQKAPKNFNRYANQIEIKQSAIQHLKIRLNALLNAQSDYLHQLASDTLQTRYNTMNDYHVRAQYNLTILLDKLASGSFSESKPDNNSRHGRTP